MLPVLHTQLFPCLSQVLINLAISSQSSMSLFQCFSFIPGGIKEHISHILEHKCSLCKYAEIKVYQPERRDDMLMMDSVHLGNLLLHIHEKSLMHTATFRLLRAIESLC